MMNIAPLLQWESVTVRRAERIREFMRAGCCGCRVRLCGCEMDDFVEQGLLYDFYGNLLTQHQRDIYEMVVCQDLSLNEIAEQTGVSKQAVSDLVRRVSRQLAGYERKLGLLQKFQRIRACCDVLDETAKGLTDAPKADEIRRCADAIRSEL